jgi:RNA polymerase sigma-70 factor, ECF subfamily
MGGLSTHWEDGLEMADASFRQIYDEHFRFVWRSLARLGVRESDLADVTQEVFVIVHRKLAEFEGRSKMTTWLFAIAMRVARDHRQSAVVRREIATDDAAFGDRADDSPDAATELDRRRRRALLDRILDELPEEHRTVFVLFEIEGMSGLDIAELLDVPTGTVHSRLRLAREAFRRSLARLEARQRFDAQEAQ